MYRTLAPEDVKIQISLCHILRVMTSARLEAGAVIQLMNISDSNGSVQPMEMLSAITRRVDDRNVSASVPVVAISRMRSDKYMGTSMAHTGISTAAMKPAVFTEQEKRKVGNLLIAMVAMQRPSRH